MPAVEPLISPSVLERGGQMPLFRQIYLRTRAAIADGRLQSGERLPSARSLAAQLGTARGTVEAAYSMLAGEGWIVARGAAGTVVAPQLGRELPPAAVPPAAKPPAGPSSGADRATPLFRMGLPALDAFPRKLWARLLAREARALGAAGLSHPDPAGEPGLRQAISAYLSISRGVVCQPEQVLITAGYQGALNLIARVLLDPGERVLFEDPGYFPAAQSLLAAGAKLVPVPVDDDGMRIEEAAAQNVPARLAVVTPSHQSPLGVALSLHRRLALLAWATGSGGWILEDDYDGEFHYRGRPLPALKSLDRDDVVIYAGTFSKVLFPALRLGYLVVPQRLLGLFQNAAASFGGVGRLEQAVVRRFIDEGYFARHLKRMRDLYAGRRAALAAALQSVFGNSMAIGLQSGGMHLLARPGGSHSDTELARLAEAQGLEISPLSMHALAAECAPGLLLSFTNTPAEQAMAAAERLYAAIGRALAPVTEAPAKDR